MSRPLARSGLRRSSYQAAVSLLVLLLPVFAWCADSAVDRARVALDREDHAAALTILTDRVSSEPGDQEARFLYARVLAWDGQREASLAQYDELLYTSPDNADYLLGKAQVYYWDSQFAAALPLLKQARTHAPHYQAVWELEARALLAIGDTASEQQYADLSPQARQRFPEAQWPEWPPATPPPVVAPAATFLRGHLEGGVEYQDLDNGQPSWKSRYVNGSYRWAGERSVYGQYRQTDRFNEQDHEVQAGIALPVLTHLGLTLEGTAAPGADVLARWSLYSRIRLALPQGFGLSAGWRHKNYEDDHLNMVTLVGERYFGNYYAAWTTYISKLEGADTNFANQLRIDRYYLGDNRVGLLFAIGKETESVGQGRFVESDTLSVVLTGLHTIAPQWAVSWDLIYHDQDDAYTRGGFRVGLRRQF